MIFVTYGTQEHDFKYLSQLINQINNQDSIVVQLGNSKPIITNPNASIENYYPNYLQLIENCDILITHSGVGSIMGGLQANKKVIAISRLAQYGEHVDDHQLEIANELAQKGYIYHMQRNEDINQVLSKVRAQRFKTYPSNTIHFVSELEKLLLGEK